MGSHRLPTRRLRFALLLPAADLALWTSTVLLPVVSLSMRLQSSGGRFFNIRPAGSWLFFALGFICRQRFPLTVSVNFPGVATGLPITLLVMGWIRSHATTLTPEIWHTLSLPLFCLPAWWFVGNCVDRIRDAREVRAAALWVSLVLAIGCIAVAIVIAIAPPSDRKDLLPFLWGACLWAVLFGVAPTAWAFRKLRVSRL